MDPIILKALESRIKECEMRIQAIADDLKIDFHYEPESCTVVPREKGEDD